MGPVFSGSIIVSMAETKKAEIPNFTGGEAANITQQGNPYIFRTSFTQATAMPKVAQATSRTTLKAKSVAVMWVNNDFGKGGRDVDHQGARSAGHQGRRRHLDRPGPGRLLRRRAQGQAVERRRAVRLHERGRVGARAARAAQAGLRQADRRRDHADRPEGDRARRRRRQRRDRARGPHRRRAAAGDQGVRRQVPEGIQVQERPQRHEGLQRRCTWSRRSPRRTARSTRRRSPRRCTARRSRPRTTRACCST